MHGSSRLIALSLLLTACQGSPPQAGRTVAQKHLAPAPARVDDGAATLGYLRGRPVTWKEMRPFLIELSGGAALVEYAVDAGLRRRMDQLGRSVSAEQIEAERALYTTTVTPDPDEAERLLANVRRIQGLGDFRFKRLLWRNAVLRMLVRDEVRVPEALVRRTYEYAYGPRDEVRLIVVPSLSEAARVTRQARKGAPFIDLAMAHSTDESRGQGGLLPPISQTDPTWPAAVRAAILTLSVGEISDPVLLDDGIGILKLESRVKARPIPYDQVKSELTRRTRLGIERTHMDRLVRQILREAEKELIITNAALERAWEAQKASMPDANQ